MARQTRSMDQINEVNNDFDLYYPLVPNTSLDVEGSTVYGTTDPEVDLSMANVLFVKDYTQFRGLWETAPTTGGQPISYATNDIVLNMQDAHFYRFVGSDGSSRPDTDSTNWSIISHEDILGARVFSTSDTYAPNNLVYRGGTVADEAGLLYVFIGATSASGANAPLPAVGTISNTHWQQVGGAPSNREQQDQDLHYS